MNPAGEDLRAKYEISRHAGELRWASLASFWLQLVTIVAAGTMLLFAVFGRELGDNASNATVTGFALLLATLGVAALGVSAFIMYRYTRLAKKLSAINLRKRPDRDTIVRMLEFGTIASLIGMLLSFLGAELGAGVLLAKSLAIPQGTDIYDPTKVIRVLDILIVLASTTCLGAHFIGHTISLGLTRRLQD